MDIRILNVCEGDATFLHKIMNDRNILDALEEFTEEMANGNLTKRYKMEKIL